MNPNRIPQNDAGTFTALAIASPLPAGWLPTGTAHAASAVLALPFPLPNNPGHLTDGIIYLAILLVVIIILGILIGRPSSDRKKEKNAKKKK